MDKIRMIPFLFCFLGTLVVSSCKNGEENHERIITVETVKVEESKITDESEYIGTIEEDIVVALSFPLQGKIQAIQGREGEFVTKGTILAEIDGQNLKKMHNAALATLNQAEDGMQRLQQLYDKESLPEIKYIEVKTQLEQARSMEAIARKNLDDIELIAPFDGVIGERSVELGENVLPNQSVYKLLKINKVLVKIPVPEMEISAIRVGDTVQIKIPALRGKNIEGVVREKGVKAHPISHTYEVRCEVNNLEKELLPGMACRVSTQRGGNNVISIPGKCVQVSNDGSRFVWVVSDNIVSRRIIEAGRLTSDGIIVTKGLQGGEQIVVSGFQKIVNGSKVEVK